MPSIPSQAWMGGLRRGCPVAAVDMPGRDAPCHLRDEADWIQKSIAHRSQTEYDAIANLVDGITAVYLKAIYKLSRLS